VIIASAWNILLLTEHAANGMAIEIDDRKINRSIDGNRLLVNWHRLTSANRWTIDNHEKVVVNYID